MVFLQATSEFRSLPSDFCHPVDLARAFRPKGNPVLIGNMTGRFGPTEELGDAIGKG
jgi:hypothetical protein